MSVSSSFDRLSFGVKRWIYNSGWNALHAVQERTIPTILQAQKDILITAPTAGGKTEAAFLPAVSWLESDGKKGSYGVLCISPLKALINDQYDRLRPLCESAGTAITPWHGDVSSSIKKRSWTSPAGVLLITPESLEAMFVTRSHALRERVASLRYVVIDEFHAFIGRERGQQLLSLLARLEELIERPICRIALSATIGDPSIALKYLRPDGSRPGEHIDASHEVTQLQLALKTYMLGKNADRPVSIDIANDLFLWLRGGNHLVFANSRRTVEEITGLLTTSCQTHSVPAAFFAHHGSLSREARHFVEQRLKNGKKPTTAIATSTLELGIDVGSVTSVVQIGAPANVSSIRQRLGRSGRRDQQPSILRLLVTGYRQKRKPCPIDLLEIELLQAIAVIELMFERWIEPPEEHALHLSTLIQQILSIIAFRGDITAARAYQLLCKQGPWRVISRDLFAGILRALGENKVIAQLPGGELIVDSIGEQLVSKHTFYTAFDVPEEYRLVAHGKMLGSLPVTTPYLKGQLLLFSGRGWAVESIDAKARVMTLTLAKNGQAPTFGGEAAPVHRRIRQRMLELYMNEHIPSYGDDMTIASMADARRYFRDNAIEKDPLVIDDQLGFWCIWESDRILDTIKVIATITGAAADRMGPCVIVQNPGTIHDIAARLHDYLASHSKNEICGHVDAHPLGKYDRYLSNDIIRRAFVEEKLDIDGTAKYLACLLADIKETREINDNK